MTSTPKRCNEMTSSFPNSPLPSNNTFVALDVNAVPKVIKITPQNELKKKFDCSIISVKYYTSRF
jgi:hypothetical protein